MHMINDQWSPWIDLKIVNVVMHMIFDNWSQWFDLKIEKCRNAHDHW